MAAYNSGPGTVQHAVERTGYADYWELYRRSALPAETRNYVPIILAITIMSKNPAQYGLDRLRREAPVPSEGVKLDSAVDLRLAAQCADTTVAMLQELNPSLLRLSTPKDLDFELRVPAGSKEQFEKAIALVPPEMRLAWRLHRVEAGESLASIARKYRVATAALAQANRIEDEDAALTADTRLVVPQAPAREGEAPVSAYAKAATRYKVRKGDTLASVANDFNLPPDMIRRWNRLKGNTLTPGRVLVIHRTAAAAPAASGKAVAEKSKSGKGKTGGSRSAASRAGTGKAGTAKGTETAAKGSTARSSSAKASSAARAGTRGKSREAAAAESGKGHGPAPSRAGRKEPASSAKSSHKGTAKGAPRQTAHRSVKENQPSR
jgi:membrane-bound lytic murein transglycosylase D